MTEDSTARRIRRASLAVLASSLSMLVAFGATSPAYATTAKPPPPKPHLGVLPSNSRILTVPSIGEYSWSQGNAPTYMGTNNRTACFLVRVSGDFEGGGEAVRIYPVGGSWYLGGSSQQAGVSANARCINTNSSEEFAWGQGNLATPMGGSVGRTCFLTSVTGHFEGGGEYVQTFIAGGSWYLGGGSLQGGVAATARCVPVPSTTGDFRWSQGATPEPMLPIAGNSCFLTSMAGRFKGGGEVVYAFGYQGWWLLGGSSQQEGVAATARCI